MKNFIESSRAHCLYLTVVVLTVLVSACEIVSKKSIDDVINEIEKTKQTIAGESSAWRDELPKLVNDLHGLESQVNSDTKGIVADTTNQIQDLATQTIQLSDAKAQDLVAQAGVEFRCNTEFVAAFVRQGVIDHLQYLIDDLQFWKKNKQHLDKKPNHAVCWINPTALSLYPSGNVWSIDTSNMGDTNIVHVFGYNFWSEALPTLELQDDHGQKIRNVNLTSAYVTHYQINLDFSNEDFAGVQPGSRVVFRWPDQDDPNTINLTLNPPAKLTISNPVFTPSSPTAQNESVTLKVTITNQGGLRSGNFEVVWKPDPNDAQVLSISRTPLNPGESLDVSFPGYVYQRGGKINTTVSLSNGDDAQSYSLSVGPPPPPPPLAERHFLNTTDTAYGNNIGGFGENREYGGDCDSGYVRSTFQVITVQTQGVAGATFEGEWGDGTILGWADANNIRSCKIRVHYSISPSGLGARNFVEVNIIISEKGE